MIKENLNLYHIFYETAICGNISMAARKLYISQPAISKAISKLENSLGVSLFVRSSRGVKLTPDGEILLKQLDTAFHAIKQGEDTIESRKESGAGSLSIGISTTLCRYLLLPYLQDFIKAHPEVKLSIFCQSSTETIAALENGLLDMGIIGETSHLDPLHFYPIRDIHDILVATKDYLSQVESATDKSPRDMLSHANLMLLDKRNITRQYIEKYLLLNEITPRQQLEVTTMDLLIEFSKIGMGVGCVIREFVEEELSNGTLLPFPMSEPIPPRKIGVALKGNVARNSPTDLLLSLLLS